MMMLLRSTLWAILGVVIAMGVTSMWVVADYLITDPADELWQDILGANLVALGAALAIAYIVIWIFLSDRRWFSS